MAATLLLADDSVTIQRVVELTFAEAGIRVVTAADGDAAIARLDEERPDIVIADVSLPGVDGYRLAERVKQSAEHAGVPVLLLSGAFDPVDDARIRDIGCDGVVVKPVDPGDLLRVVTGLLDARVVEDASPASEAWPSVAPDTVEGAAPDESPLPSSSPMDPFVAALAGLEADDLDAAFGRQEPEPGQRPQPAPEAAPAWDLPVSALSSGVDVSGALDVDVTQVAPELFAGGDEMALEPVIAEPVVEAFEAVEQAWPEPAPAPAPAPAPTPAPATTPVRPAVPGLADAFAALLAAEQARPVEPSPSLASGAAGLTGAAIEDVIDRVVARLGGGGMAPDALASTAQVIREELSRLAMPPDR